MPVLVGYPPWRYGSSTAAFDRPGEGSARPRIIRGFRPEIFSDDEAAGDEKSRTKKSVKKSRTGLRHEDIYESCTRTTYDGREVVVVSLKTQTDWEWVSHLRAGTLDLLKRKRSKIAKIVKMKSSVLVPKSGTQVGDGLMGNLLESGQGYSSESDDLTSESDSDIGDYDATLPMIHISGPEDEKPDARKSDIDPHAAVSAVFNGACEYCQQPVKPFPTLEQQLQLSREELYCCSEYEDFVMFALLAASELEEEENEKNKLIDVKPHKHVGSKEERKAAKEKNAQRLRERELQRRVQEAVNLPQNIFSSMPGGAGILAAGYKGLYKMGGPLSMKDMHAARQMKTVSYQLSSIKCLDDGWTLRPPSPLLSNLGNNVFEMKPLDTSLFTDGKLRKRSLMRKYYETGQIFLTVLPDGTGNIFYPSGCLAILISSFRPGQYQYIIHQDLDTSEVLADFEPNGYGYCNYPNGALRVFLDQYGGVEMSSDGSKRQKWSWKDLLKQEPAFPLQPICIKLNRHIAIRIISQENIILTFSANQRNCRFNIGSKLKLVAPQNLPMKEIRDDYLYLEEKKNCIETTLNKISNQLNFPNCPILDRILPPLHVTNKITRTEKLKEERQCLKSRLSMLSRLSQASPTKLQKESPVISESLSSIP